MRAVPAHVGTRAHVGANQRGRAHVATPRSAAPRASLRRSTAPLLLAPARHACFGGAALVVLETTRRSQHVRPFAAIACRVDGDAPTPAEPLSLAVCALALCNGVALASAWLLRADAAVSALSAASLALCAPLCADVAWRAAAPGAPPLQLALEAACAVLLAVQSLEGLAWLAFTPAGCGAAAVVRAVLPLACCAWVCRLGTATPLWAEHRAAAAAADAAVARAAAEGTARRLLDAGDGADAERAPWRGAAEMLAARSGALWHRLTAMLSLADWALLAALWSAMEPAAAPPGAPVLADAAWSAAAWFLPALLAVDASRIATQLLHGAARGRGRRLRALLLPAGVPSRLAGGLLVFNCGCSAALLALALCSPARAPALPRAVLAARFLRLICECAFLVASASVPPPATPAPLRLGAARDMRAACDAAAAVDAPARLGNAAPADAAAADAAPADAAPEHWALRALRAAAAEFLPFAPPTPAPTTTPPPAPPAPPPAAEPPRAPPRLGLDAFSSLALAGVRGYLRGDEAAAAVARIFSEADADASGEVSAAEIGSWVAREPPDGGGVKWRASVRRVLGALPALAAPPLADAPRAPPSAASSAAPAVDAPATPRYRPRGLRLLSLEGGGIKGLVLIWQLQAIERATGRPIYDLFDLIGGTSTGGILAVALANRVPLARLEVLYADIARDVFAGASVWRQLRYGHSSDAAPLARVLQQVLGADTLMRQPGRQPAAFVVTTCTEAPAAAGAAARLELRVLRTYNSPAPSGGRDGPEAWRQWEAALATSAAPTILPPLRRADGATFVDGALSGNNNPSLLVLTEGLQLAAAAGRPVDIVLSLGCGEAAGTSAGEGSRAAPGAGSLLFWLGQVVNLAFDASLQEERTQRLMAQICPSARYARLSPVLRTDCALAEHRAAPLAALRADTTAYLWAQREELSRLAAWLAQDDVEDETGGGLLPGVGQLSEAMLL